MKICRRKQTARCLGPGQAFWQGVWPGPREQVLRKRWRLVLATGAVAGVTAYVIAKHKATERQRRYAEERARLAYENAPAPRQAQYRKTRYIAVDTVREKDSSGAKSVMIYDTQTQQVVGNNVYDVKQSPKQGTVSKFDTYSAEYVGTGA